MLKENAFACPIEAVLQVIGGRWKTILLYHPFQGTYRCSDLQTLCEWAKAYQEKRSRTSTVAVRKCDFAKRKSA